MKLEDRQYDREHMWARMLRASKERGQHLEPEDSPFITPPTPEHYRLIAEDLLVSLEAEVRPLARELVHPEVASVLCLPSWSPRWALTLVGESKYSYTILLTEPDYVALGAKSASGLAGAPTAQDVPRPLDNGVAPEVSMHRSQLPKEMAVAICDVWHNVLLQTRYPREHLFGCCDGVTYHFAYRRHDQVAPMGGQTWSPPAGTPAGHLVTLAHALRDYVMSPEPSNQQLLKQIEQNVAWFRSRVG